MEQIKKILKEIYKLLTFQLNLPVISILIVMALSAFFVISMARKRPETFGLLKGATILEEEQKALIAKVSQLIALPEDEDPTVATVSDKDQLDEQAFFKNAQKGDKVLIYTNASKVILYRPSENRVVEVGAVNIKNEDSGLSGVEDIEVMTNRFAILNGTSLAGLASNMEKELKNILPDAEVLSKINAQVEYGETILVDLKGARGEEAKNLAKDLGIKVGSLPEGESVSSDADFLIIVGNDKAPQAPEEKSEE